MANIKKYDIEHDPTFGGISVEIDFDYQFVYGNENKTMNEFIQEMANFWSGSKSRLNENEGDYLITFLKYLCETALAIQLEFNYNLSGVISAFENREGWCSMDGTEGIKLISIDEMNLSGQEDYTVTEL